MDAYLELNLTSDIIREIKEHRKIDRTAIAIGVINGMLANSIDNQQGIKPFWYMQPSELAKEAVQYTDALIAELNK